MTDYHAWEVSDGEHHTDVYISNKTVICKKKSVPGITLTIGMFFDGTGNNAFNTDLRLTGQCTHEDVGMSAGDADACLKKLHKGGMGDDSSYGGYYSNIHWLYSLYHIDNEVAPDKSIFQKAIYVDGIGTEKYKEDSLIGMGIGAIFDGVVDKTNEGISFIPDKLNEFINKNESINFAIEKIQFDVFGFSRGAAAARHFANRVRRGDKTIENAIIKGLDGRNQHGKPAGEVRFLGLFDTVCAVGTVTNLFDVHGPVNPGVELDLPPDIAQKVFQITAMHESRYNFSLNSIKGYWPELALPGVHSDIGGGYNPSESEYCFLTQPVFETVKEEVSNDDTSVYKSAAATQPDLRVVPALKYIIPSGEMKVETWYDYLVSPEENRLGIIKKRVGAAVTFYRTVKNDWSKVSLRVMLDAAKEQGLQFHDILPKDDKLYLPPELESLCQKAINQGKMVRNGGTPTPFTFDELLLIGKYIHCSANWNPVRLKKVWLDGKQIKTIYGAVPVSDVFGFINRPCDRWMRAIWNMKGEKS